jgi:hypothetical protein
LHLYSRHLDIKVSGFKIRLQAALTISYAWNAGCSHLIIRSRSSHLCYKRIELGLRLPETANCATSRFKYLFFKFFSQCERTSGGSSRGLYSKAGGLIVLVFVFQRYSYGLGPMILASNSSSAFLGRPRFLGYVNARLEISPVS